MRTVIEASCRMYRVVLYLYPSRLRAEFGDDMLSVFEQQLLDAARSTGGFLEVCRIWARTLWETTQLVTMPCPASSHCAIAAISVLSSSALFLFLFRAAGLARHCVK
jgi:hypothetical protein